MDDTPRSLLEREKIAVSIAVASVVDNVRYVVMSVGSPKNDTAPATDAVAMLVAGLRKENIGSAKPFIIGRVGKLGRPETLSKLNFAPP